MDEAHPIHPIDQYARAVVAARTGQDKEASAELASALGAEPTPQIQDNIGVLLDDKSPVHTVVLDAVAVESRKWRKTSP